MIKFDETISGVDLIYCSDQQDNEWVWQELQKHGSVTLSRVFTFKLNDLVSQPSSTSSGDKIEEFEYRFRFAKLVDEYFLTEGRIFEIPNEVLITKEGLRISRKLFVAERNISIMKRIADLLPKDQDIIIGGDRKENIPIEIYEELLAKFPNTTEMNRYAAARVDSVVGDYFAKIKDARGYYETYRNKTSAIRKSKTALNYPDLIQVEIDKYKFIKDTISSWLVDGEVRPESEWQEMIIRFLMLIFPKYLAILRNVMVHDFYSNGGSKTKRFIDIALVDASGNIDVIEVKKPFEDALLRRGEYRGNFTPSRELSGSIMQAEKYLFYLSKWGVEGEKILTEKYKCDLPKNLSIRITNPKAMIILGRDQNKKNSPALSPAQLLDFEIIKRKYANMIDILTYDDLLRRLDNIIAALKLRIDETEVV